MITLKAGLMAAAVTGTVAAGGATWAAVGYTTNARPADLPIVAPATSALMPPAQPTLPAIPGCVPTSVPTSLHVTLAPGAALPADKAKCLPSGVPTSLPSALPTKLPLPAGIPTTLPQLDCSKLPPAVQPSGSSYKSLSLLGLQYDSSRSWSITYQGKDFCATAQTWKDRLGGWVTAERLKGQATLDQIQQAFKLPQVQPFSFGGTTFWQSALGGGQGGLVIWSPEPGAALDLESSPAYAPRLPGLAEQLRQAG